MKQRENKILITFYNNNRFFKIRFYNKWNKTLSLMSESVQYNFDADLLLTAIP